MDTLTNPKPTRLTAPTYSFTQEEAQVAFEKWGCNCGPSALATMLGISLDAAHVAIPNFDERKYTSPTMMKEALEQLGVKFTDRKSEDKHDVARYGLTRIQIEGPWYGRFAYHRTHWVGSMRYSVGGLSPLTPDSPAQPLQEHTYVFDINGGWLTFDDWNARIMPQVIAMYKRATGDWSATHRWELAI